MISRLFLALLLVSILPSHAQEHPAKLRVGIFALPPLAMKDEYGHWSGLSVDLWERVAQQLDIQFEYVEAPIDDVLQRLNHGDLDLAVAEFGVSADREREVDFTQPIFATSIAAAFPKETAFVEWRQILKVLTSHGLFPVIAVMLGTLIVFSLLLWAIERRVQQTHFGGRPIHGFGSAIWFAAVTMTTVGYGDKTPQTPLGRLFALVWMFLGILLVSAFTGSVASSFTVAQLSTSMNRIGDLAHYHAGVLEGSLARNILASNGISAAKFSDVGAGLAALKKGTISAFVGDEVILKYEVELNYPDSLRVSSIPHTHVTYAMATRPSFPELEAINVAILETVNSRDWQQHAEEWVGDASTP